MKILKILMDMCDEEDWSVVEERIKVECDENDYIDYVNIVNFVGEYDVELIGKLFKEVK